MILKIEIEYDGDSYLELLKAVSPEMAQDLINHTSQCLVGVPGPEHENGLAKIRRLTKIRAWRLLRQELNN